jgi:hypothetical protein
MWGTNWIYICYVEESRPPLLTSGQSSWLLNGDVLCFLWGTNWIYICYGDRSIASLMITAYGSRIESCLSRIQMYSANGCSALLGLNVLRWLVHRDAHKQLVLFSICNKASITASLHLWGSHATGRAVRREPLGNLTQSQAVLFYNNFTLSASPSCAPTEPAEVLTTWLLDWCSPDPVTRNSF